MEHPIFEYIDFLNFTSNKDIASDVMYASVGNYSIGGSESIRLEISIYKMFPIYTSEFILSNYMISSKFDYYDSFNQDECSIKTEIFKHSDLAIIEKVSGVYFIDDVCRNYSRNVSHFILSNINLFS